MAGWQTLTDGFSWFVGQGRFPLPAYSEFMPPPRLGISPCGELDPVLFAADENAHFKETPGIELALGTEMPFVG